ncbi:MAG: TnpV protein, partial [Hydrogeniiclostridium mannosilyticum]
MGTSILVVPPSKARGRIRFNQDYSDLYPPIYRNLAILHGTGITYTLQGDYYVPNFTLPAEEKTKSIGVWGQRHCRYLKEHRKA